MLKDFIDYAVKSIHNLYKKEKNPLNLYDLSRPCLLSITEKQANIFPKTKICLQMCNSI